MRIPMGTSNAYLIQGSNGYILIDAGNANKIKKFKNYLNENNITPADIKLIVITHVHYDHVGSLRAIKELCQCPVLVHQAESQLLKTGQMPFPQGTNLLVKSIVMLGKYFAKNIIRFPAVAPDIEIDNEFSLQEYGIGGRVIPTPGHSQGSISVLLASGEAFVGDLVINYLPFGRGPIFPPFAENIEELLRSWQKIIDVGAKSISPGHGKSFNVDKLINKLNDKTKRYKVGG